MEENNKWEKRMAAIFFFLTLYTILRDWFTNPQSANEVAMASIISFLLTIFFIFYVLKE